VTIAYFCHVNRSFCRMGISRRDDISGTVTTDGGGNVVGKSDGSTGITNGTNHAA